MTDEPTQRTSPSPEDDVVTPVRISMLKIVGIGMVVWAVALVLTLAVPILHQDDRWWWPWCCVAGIGLGAIGLAYLRRGRGNAADA